jgi:PAS domain S-box-containing protein
MDSHLVSAVAHKVEQDSNIESSQAASCERFVQTLVGRLRERNPGGLEEVLAPILAERNEAIAEGLSSGAKRLLMCYDRLIIDMLSKRYDSLDAAVRVTSFAIAEIDGVGLISYANDALKKLLPDALGRDFAALFGPRSHVVRRAIAEKRRETLRLDLHRGDLPSVHLRGEIGPLTDELSRSGAYALLLGVGGEEARFDTFPDGILRLDPEGKVVFANRRAEDLIGACRNELHGRLAESLFRVCDGSDNATQNIAEWLRSPDGRRSRVDLLALNGAITPVRITVAPSFDTSEGHAGAIVTIAPITDELVKAELQRLLSTPDLEPEEIVRGVMNAIGKIIPYDLATFGVYTEDLKYHKTLVVNPRPNWKWTTAWFSLGENVRDYLLSDQTWGDDLRAIATSLTPGIDEDDVLRQILEAGMKGFITLPIAGGGRRVRASLTLLSRQTGCYGRREIMQMRNLGVERALLIAEANMLRRREERVRELQRLLASVAYGRKELAHALADGVANCFGWDYVAVFGVDRREELFRLIYQCNRTGGRGADPDYVQPLTEGLLGSALRDNAPLAEPDIEAGSQFGYKPVIPGRRSALAIPLRPISDEIDWILSVESSKKNAFRGPCMISLVDLLSQCEDILRQRWLKAVQSCLLDAVEQAVVIVDRAGKLRLTNRWANTLFGFHGGILLGQYLKDFGASDPDRRLLSSTTPIAQVSLTLSIDQGVHIPTLATQRPLNDDHGHCLWLFTDLREQAQQSNLSYLEETVNEVAQNARLPLLMAESLLRKVMASLSRDPAAVDMLDRAVRQLEKADITYERLASTLAMRQEPDRPGQLFDAVEVFRQAISDLPQEDFEYCDLSEFPTGIDFAPFEVFGWSEQLSFAFRSLLAYALFQRPIGSKVRIRLAYPAPRLAISISVPNWPTEEQETARSRIGRIGIAQEKAREVASLSSEAIKAAIKRHNGALFDDSRSSLLTFRIELQQLQQRVYE